MGWSGERGGLGELLAPVASVIIVLAASCRKEAGEQRGRADQGERGGLGKDKACGVPHQLGELLAPAASELIVLIARC